MVQFHKQSSEHRYIRTPHSNGIFHVDSCPQENPVLHPDPFQGGGLSKDLSRREWGRGGDSSGGRGIGESFHQNKKPNNFHLTSPNDKKETWFKWSGRWFTIHFGIEYFAQLLKLQMCENVASYEVERKGVHSTSLKRKRGERQKGQRTAITIII